MAGDSLQTILEAERELLATLAEERQRAADWLAAQRAAIDQEGVTHLAAFRQACQLHDKAGREAAAREAAASLDQSRHAVDEIAALDDAILERIVVRQLRALLPVEDA